MSSDESTSTNISTFSNRAEGKLNIKPHKPETWEINLVGNFLLDLYHRSIITAKDDWVAKKSEMREKFSEFATPELRQRLKELNGTDNIGTLLNRCGFLINTTRGAPLYKIRCKALFEFRNNKLKDLDNFKINYDGITQEKSNDRESNSKLQKLSNEKDDLIVDENEPKIPLEYQGSKIQRRVTNFCPTNMSCFICQEDFSSMEAFEEHVQIHGDETDFEFLSTMDKFNSPIFTVNYRLCKNSHLFCFEFETCLENLIIDKIIIVQSRSFFYIHNMRVPYKCPESGVDRFFVDSHLFTIHMEQPIILICHVEDSKESRIIEQHHFMRSEEFPKVNFSINPNRLPNKKLFQPKFQLADYFPPKEIQDALKDDFYHQKLMITSNEFRDYVRNENKLQPQTIGASLNILLQIEDIDTIQEYLSLKQQNIQLRSYGDEYSFQLKPKQRIFLENILSVYDELILTTRTDIFTNTEEIMQLMLQNKSDIRRMKNTYVGLIQAVNTGRISFKCDQKINMRDSYVVICRPSRLNFRYQYRSLQLLSMNMDFLRKFLFPTKITYMPLSTKTINLYNKNINDEQLQAVRNIAEGPRNDATYVIFGPPGTGKTTTLVEGILQILARPDTKILVTASSNSACDEVALRLCKYLKQLDIKRVMVRIYSRSSEIRTETIDEELLENSNMYNGQFYPDVEILHEYRIVICTLSIVAKLATGKFGRKENGSGLFTHLFIDEVAASTEVEALMAITTILTPQSSFVISGDHKQLGPILQSQRAKNLGLDASLMDRLLARDCYRVDDDTGDYDRTIQTRLVRNYRSHPAIVNLYSGLYYNHSLEPCAKPDEVSLCEIWHKSRNKQYPILFHALYEPSTCDRQSHSLYNLKELQVVMDYVKDLMYFGINGEPVKENDIGIISPYKKQYRRIQEELNLRKWFGIETGSVETFQGKEKNIIIVSFVRSGTSNLGFLDNPRRLNVTISRPKSLLILIGNPKTLSLNSDFEYIIRECRHNNTFVGSNGPSTGGARSQLTGNASTKPETLAELMQKLQVHSVESSDQVKVGEISQKNRQRKRGERKKNRRSKSNQALNSRTDVDKDLRNKKNVDEDDDDDDDDDESNENDQASTSALATKNSNLKNSSGKDQEKAGEISQKSQRRGRSKQRNKNNEKSNERNGVDKDSDNNDDEEDDADDDDDDDNESQDNGNDKRTTSVSGKKSNSKKNSRKGYDTRQSQKSAKANGGKISKQHGKGRQNSNNNITDKNIKLDKNKLDSIFDGLPQVPSTTSTQPTTTSYTKEQILQLQQQQQQYFNNFQHNEHANHNRYFNLPTANAAFMQTAHSAFNPCMTPQQQPNFNSFQHQNPFNYTSQFVPASNPFGPNKANLSCFKNNTTKGNSYNSNVETRKPNKNASVSANKYDLRVRNNNTNSNKSNGRVTGAAATANTSKGNKGNQRNASKPFNSESSTKAINKMQGEQKTSYASGAVNLVSKGNSSTSGGNMTNTIDKNCKEYPSTRSTAANMYPFGRDKSTTNAGGNDNNTITKNLGDDKPSYPVSQDNFGKFSNTMAANNVKPSSLVKPVVPHSSTTTNNSSIQNNSISDTKSIGGTRNFTAPAPINNSSMQSNYVSHSNSSVTPRASVSTNSYPRNLNFSTNTYNSNSNHSVSSTSTNNTTQRNTFSAYEAREYANRPVRTLGFNPEKKTKKDDSCVLS